MVGHHQQESGFVRCKGSLRVTLLLLEEIHWEVNPLGLADFLRAVAALDVKSALKKLPL